MFKKLISFLLVAMMLVLTSCGNGGVVETTTDAITTVDPAIAKMQETQACCKLIVHTKLYADTVYPGTAISNESPDSKESFEELVKRFIEVLKMYDYVDFDVCIEWLGEKNADLVSKIESEYSVQGKSCLSGSTRFDFSMEDFDLSQDEYCDKLSEFLYSIVRNDYVKRVLLSDWCNHIPTPSS